jgi:GT2 family glycosyltransferase
MSEISVLIVNYNTAELAIGAVESVLAREHGGRTVDVHLLDNASPEGDSAALRKAAEERGWGARVTLHVETVNHGFGRGNNLLLERLARRKDPPEKVLFLNPDARLKNEAIAILAEFLDGHPEVGLAGARVEKPDGRPVTAAFRFPSLIGEFSGTLAFGPVAQLCARWQVPLSPGIPSMQADWVSGAAVMARFEALADVGFFDPGYFLYFEEVDLMLQTAHAGWQTWYVAEAEIIHIEGAATSFSSDEKAPRRRPAYWYHSWQHYFCKNHGRAYAMATSAAWVSGVLLNRGIARLRGRTPATTAHVLRDFWAVAGRQIFGLEARPYD